MIGVVTTLSTNLFRTFIIKRFMTVFFQTDIEEKGKEKVVYSLFFVLTALVHLLYHFPPINIIVNLLLIYLITQLYEGRQKKKILVAFLIYGINMICDIIATYSYNNYIVGREYREITPYITVFLIIICEFIIERFLIKQRKVNFTPPYWGILIAIPIISIILLLILIMNNLNNRTILVSISAGILFINLLIFYLYDALVRAYIKLEESALFEKQIASYSNQLNVMMQSEKKISALRHDMKHHMNQLLLKANRHHCDDIIEYLKSMYAFIDNPHEYVDSGNKEIDSLMNYMLDKAERILRKVEYHIRVPEELEIRSFDLNVIVRNLLDNAIEAASHSEKKWLFVSINYEQGMLFIRISNSYNHVIQKKGDKYITTKKETVGHGNGLENVKRVVESYKGTMQTEDENNIFDVKIILYTLFMK